MIRDGLNGFTRFDEFQKSLNTAPNMLTRRLNALVDAGLAACRYSKWPPRFEYIFSPSRRRFPAGGDRDGRPGATAISRPRVQALCWWIEKLQDRSMTATFSLPPAPLLTSGHVAATQSLIQTVEIQRSGKRALP